MSGISSCLSLLPDWGTSRRSPPFGCFLLQQRCVSLLAAQRSTSTSVYLFTFLFLKTSALEVSERQALPIIVFMRTHTDASACYLLPWPTFNVAIGPERLA
jgi:hypothetical protein